MSVDKVYFSKNIETVLDNMDIDKLGKKVAIKVHFGEKGCNTYISPELVKKVYDRITASGRKAELVECNVLYKGSRVNTTEHIKTAREHGFDMPIRILDGEKGDDYVDWDGCKIGAGVVDYDSMVVLSHFKGHIAAGFGGAIKNLAMGLGSRAGKLDMHSNMRPSISADCIGCGICVENCDFDAIRMESGKATINTEVCQGCAMCIAVCPQRAVQIPWQGRTHEELQKRMAEYAGAILTHVSNLLYINVLTNITELCDCMGVEQTPMMEDVGVLYSEFLLPIEKASLDLANKYSDGKFDSINTVDKTNQIKVAEELGLGSGEYELVESK